MLPERIGPYELVERLGEGGMGEVFRAVDKRLDRTVALKRIHDDVELSEARRERLRREARSLAKLNHASIVQLYDVISYEGSDWLVLEHIDGPNIRQQLEAGALSQPQTLYLGRQIAEGLRAAHSQGIVHRDLKAENVLVTAEGTAKLVDFGIAKETASTQDPSLTADGRVVGTPRAMSPEQAAGFPIGPRSDLFSLGILLYEMLSRRSPFRGPAALQEQQQIPVHELAPNVSPQLSKLIDHLLEKNPLLRPRDAEEVANALERIAEDGPSITEHDADFTLAYDLDQSTEVDDDHGASTASEAGPRRLVTPPVPAMVVLSAALALLALSWPRPLGLVLKQVGFFEEPVSDLPSIAVLPFENRTSSSEWDLFCRGLAEDLIDTLERIPELSTIPYISVATYETAPVPSAKALAEELGIRYVVQGSLGMSQERISVKARLIDVESDRQLFNEDFALRPQERLESQLKLSRRMIDSLNAEIDRAELERIEKRAKRSLNAYHLFLRGRDLMRQNRRITNESARDFLRRAIQLDPTYADAYSTLAATYVNELTQFWTTDPSAMEEHIHLARQALELDPRSAETYTTLAVYHMVREEPHQALKQAEGALSIKPKLDAAHAARGGALALLGRPLEALKAFRLATRSGVNAPPIVRSGLGALKKRVGLESEAMDLWEALRYANSDLIHPRIWLIYSYVERGKVEQAQTLAAEALDINPRLTAKAVAEHFGKLDSRDPAAVDRRLEMLQRAGIR